MSRTKRPNGTGDLVQIQPIRVEADLRRRFAVRCARLGLRQSHVLEALVEAFSRGAVDDEVLGAKERE